MVRDDKGLRKKHRNLLEACGAGQGEKRSVASMHELKLRVNGVKRPVAPGAHVPQPRPSSRLFSTLVAEDHPGCSSLVLQNLLN
jgi:hypothetical protein